MTYLTVEEVALQFRVSKMTIYRLIESGDLCHIKIGRSYRIPKSEVDALHLGEKDG